MSLFKKLHILFLLILFPDQSQAFTLISNQITAGWNATTLAFDVNESSCTALGISAATLNTAIDAAVALWNKTPTTAIKLARGATTSSVTSTNPPTIYCSNTSQTNGVAGVGTITQTTAGHPSQGSLYLNADSTKSAYFGGLTSTQQAIIVAHEIGHVLGLGHSEKPYALMYFDISTKANLNLSQDDMDGLTWLNPRNELGAGLMGCGTIRDINNHMPPSDGMGGVAFNWALLILVAFAGSKAARGIRLLFWMR